jgi:hypothetical protein
MVYPFFFLKKQVQIDLVGNTDNKNEYLIGSCKFRNEPIGIDELKAADRGEVRLVTLDDMY